MIELTELAPKSDRFSRSMRFIEDTHRAQAKCAQQKPEAYYVDQDLSDELWMMAEDALGRAANKHLIVAIGGIPVFPGQLQ